MSLKPEGSLISHFSRLAMKAGGINLAQGRPGYPPPEKLLKALIRRIGEPDLHQYAPGNGIPGLLELLADRYGVHAPLTPDNLLVLNGATEGISLSFHYLTTILERPFSALSFDPVYEAYPRLAAIFGVPFIPFDFDPITQEVDFDRLEETITRDRVKVILVASPGNPLGKVWTREEVVRLVEMAGRTGSYIIFDAVYEHIYFESVPYNPLDLQYERLFFVSSFSKTLSITGWRVGYLISKTGHMEKIRAIHDYTGLSAPHLLQWAILDFMQDEPALEAFTGETRKLCGNALQYLDGEMRRMGFSVPTIRGGFFLWARLPHSFSNGYDFAVDLFEKARVAIVPGENFSETKTDHVRLNMTLQLPEIEEAMRRLKEVLG